jgi:hypothetical protein
MKLPKQSLPYIKKSIIKLLIVVSIFMFFLTDKVVPTQIQATTFSNKSSALANSEFLTTTTSIQNSATKQIALTEEVTKKTLNEVNPLEIVINQDGAEVSLRYSGGPSEDLNTPAGILNRVIQFVFPIAGAALFVMLIWAGFEIFAGAPNKSSLESGKNRAIMAIAGFLLIFISYWIVQILESLLGIKIFF